MYGIESKKAAAAAPIHAPRLKILGKTTIKRRRRRRRRRRIHTKEKPRRINQKKRFSKMGNFSIKKQQKQQQQQQQQRDIKRLARMVCTAKQAKQTRSKKGRRAAAASDWRNGIFLWEIRTPFHLVPLEILAALDCSMAGKRPTCLSLSSLSKKKSRPNDGMSRDIPL
jgi:hypothetical protein